MGKDSGEGREIYVTTRRWSAANSARLCDHLWLTLSGVHGTNKNANLDFLDMRGWSVAFESGAAARTRMKL